MSGMPETMTLDDIIKAARCCFSLKGGCAGCPMGTPTKGCDSELLEKIVAVLESVRDNKAHWAEKY